MKIRNPFNWNLRFGTIPSEFSEAMTYEEQVMWLYYQIKELKEGSANYNYDLLENKPSIDGVVLQGNITKTQLGIEQNYSILANKPSINSITLVGNKSLNDFGIQGKLIAGSGIRISGNTISATGGGSGTSDYTELENLPSINDVELIGNLYAREIGLQNELNVNYEYFIQQNKVFNMTNIQVGDTISSPELITFPTSNSIIINTSNGMHFDLEGDYELITARQTAYNVYEVTSKYSTEGEILSGYVDISSENGLLIVNFNNFEEYPQKIKLVMNGKYLQNQIENNKIKILDVNITLNSDGTISPEIKDGLYYTSFYKILDDASTPNTLVDNYQLFYFNKIDTTFITGGFQIYYDTNSNEWSVTGNDFVEDTLTNSHDKIPTSYAVYQALQNIPSGSSFYNELTSNIILNADGTTTPVLEEGYYHNGDTYTIGDGDHNYNNYQNAIFYYNPTQKEIINFIYQTGYENLVKEYLKWDNVNGDLDHNYWIHNYSELTNEIDSDNDNIPTNKAVKDYIASQTGKQNYSTDEQVIGKWIDGKPLYQKTIEFTTIPQVTTDGTQASTSINLPTSCKYAFIVNSFAYSTNAVPSGSTQTLPYVNNAGYQLKTMISKVAGGNTLAIQLISTGTAYNSYYKVTAIVNYTKLTD